jgi:hypothetical protein
MSEYLMQTRPDFDLGAFEHAGKWLATIPREGFWMSTRAALQLRFGINLGNNILSCACGKALAQITDTY